MDQESAPKKTMYHVEKFEPAACPYCGRQFRSMAEDWTNYFGTVIGGQCVFDPDWPRIICRGCKGLVKIKRLEECQVGDRSLAEYLVKEQGFCNLIVVEATGSHTQDHRVVFSGDSSIQVFPI